MLLIKRILASLINFSAFILATFALYPIFKFFNLEIDDDFFLLIVFCVVYFIPILSLKSTIGLKICNIYPNSYLRLFLKYCIYYAGTSGLIFGLMYFVIDLSRLQGSELLIFYLAFTIPFIIPFSFILTSGHYNFLDYLLNLVHGKVAHKRKSTHIILIWYVWIYLLVVIALLFKMLSFPALIDYVKKPSSPIHSNNYYPIEIFNNYTIGLRDLFYESSDIIVFTDSASLLSNKIVGQKTIYANINESTFLSNNKRYELCYLLLRYSSTNDSLNNIYSKVDQTKFLFLYSEQNGLFTHKCYLFTYYYDHNNPYAEDLIYGGINLDSLNRYYLSHRSLLNEALAQTLNIDVQSLLQRTDKKGNINFTDSELRVLDTVSYQIEFPLQLYPIHFDSVKPSTTISFLTNPERLSPQYAEISSGNHKKLITSLYLRNKNYYSYYFQ